MNGSDQAATGRADTDLGESVLAVVSDVLGTPPDTLRQQPVLAVYDWDSLASLEALAQLESRFTVRLDLTDFHAARTVEDLAALVAGARHADR